MNTTSMTEKATATQIRESFKRDGYEIRIRKTGRIEFRRDENDFWREGRWVSEYRINDDGQVFIP